jgi:hypothetical protein
MNEITFFVDSTQDLFANWLQLQTADFHYRQVRSGDDLWKFTPAMSGPDAYKVLHTDSGIPKSHQFGKNRILVLGYYHKIKQGEKEEIITEYFPVGPLMEFEICPETEPERIKINATCVPTTWIEIVFEEIILAAKADWDKSFDEPTQKPRAIADEPKEREKPQKPGQKISDGGDWDDWFNYYHDINARGYKYTLKDLAKEVEYSYGYVKQKHSEYKAEWGVWSNI